MAWDSCAHWPLVGPLQKCYVEDHSSIACSYAIVLIEIHPATSETSNNHSHPPPIANANQTGASRLLQLLLWSELVGVAALLLSAVGRTGWETGVALSADHLVAVELASQGLERGFDDTTTETEDEMEGRFLLNIVVGEGSSILKLLSSKDQSLLVGGNAFLVLDLRLDIVDRVGGLDLKGDSLAGEGLYEDLHLDGIG